MRLGMVFAVSLMLVAPAWPNGDTFFRTKEVNGKPQFVIFGSVKDDHGKHLRKAAVTVSVAVHQVEFSVQTDVLGRYRTPDVGRAVKDLGYDVDPSEITLSVEYAGYRLLRREYRGKYAQKKGAVEVNFVMTRE